MIAKLLYTGDVAMLTSVSNAKVTDLFFVYDHAVT